MNTIRKPYPSDISKPEFDFIAHLIPAAKPGGRPRSVDLHEVLNVIFYVAKTGVQWPFLPHDFPPCQSVWEYFNSWSAAGILAQINAARVSHSRQQQGRTAAPSLAIIDTQSVRNAAETPAGGYDGYKKIKGIKRAVAVDVEGHLLAIKVVRADTPERVAAQALGEAGPGGKTR